MEDLKKIQEFFSKPLDENRKLTFNDFVRMVRDDMMAGSAPDERPSEELVGKRAKAYYNDYLQGADVDSMFENVNEISKESAWKEFQEKRHVTDKTAAAARKDFDKGWDEGKFKDGNYKNISESDYSPMGYAKKVANGEMSLIDARKESNIPYAELADLVKKINPKFSAQVQEETNATEDIPDIIAVDVPLFIRLLEYAREDSENDLDLHDVAERAIEAVKLRGVLSMDDYETLVASKEELDEKMLVPKDKIERMARDIAAKFFTSKADKGEAIEILKQAVRDVYKNLDPEAEIQEAEGYSKFLEDDPEFPGGKTPGLTSDVMDRILQKIMKDVDEAKQLGEGVIEEDLCPKGKAYIKKRMAAGEKSSAYLSGRAVKVCKGQMEG